MSAQKDWKHAKKSLRAYLLLATTAGTGASAYLWGGKAAGVTMGAILCLALGFWITELMIGVFTKTVKANGTALVLIFLGKLGWWGSLLWVSQRMPTGFERPIGLGIGSFLLAILISMIQHYGMPRISESDSPNDS